MNINEKRQSQALIMEIAGRLDASTSPELEKKLKSLFDKGEKFFVFDFTQLDYISSAGLRVLLMAAKKSSAAGGKVLLACLQENVKEVFDIAGFTAIFPICSSQQEAVGLLD